MQSRGLLLVSYAPIEKDWLQARNGEGCGRQADRHAGTVHDGSPALLNLHRHKQGDHSSFAGPHIVVFHTFVIPVQFPATKLSISMLYSMA